MLILEVLMGLNSKQGDITAAFIHAGIPDDKKVYIEMPIGFETFSNNGHKKCLKRKKTFYGIRYIPRTFWKHMKNKLE